jgi:hypothetical protein
MVYKPNMTINAIAPIFARAEQLAQLSPATFAKQLAARNNDSPATSILRNSFGAIVALTPLNWLNAYIAQFHDFEAKLALFNQRYHFQLKPEKMKNPYYGNEVPIEMDGNLCFSGPLNDSLSLRCLRVKNNSPVNESVRKRHKPN